MAQSIGIDELQLKKRARRRLVGAIALVLAVVVFLPMVLDNEPRPISQDVSINIPAPPEPEEDANTDSEPLRFNPVDDSSSSSTPDKPTPLPAAQTREPVKQRSNVAAVVPDKVVKPPQPKPAVKSAAAKTGYVVQLGAFSNAKNADNLAAKVRDNRFSAYTEKITTPQGARTRVRVGPYPTRADAEQARDRLKARKLTLGEPAIMIAGE